MTCLAYLFCISRADEARQLHALRAEIRADDSLPATEKDELEDAIGRRFGWLNRQPAATQKPRWA